ncbi:hypothetical protein [Photobacterium leiognathi]|uniref:hypothetical protein n=1 Tax=Photobacterium leiognathi TaxID=553611 RepID=UPI00076AC9D0|nr:hypothetical protein [Photobacterium leiognathi]
MQFNKSIIATTLLSIFALSGCNSGGSDSTSTSPVVQTKTITVIDGALENAQICVDLNDNNQCDKSDKVLPQLTNQAGKIEVSLDDAKHALIAQIIAGTTKDSDEITPVSHSYSMITDAGKAVITPFTTLANVDPQALSNIAGDLGIDQQVLLGDLSTSPKARILARSMTPLMTDDIKNIAQQKAKFKAVINKIEEAENNDTLSQLENSRIVINKDGKAAIQPLVKNIADVLVGKTWSIASLNDYEYCDNGVASVNFKDTKNLEFTDDEGINSATYSIDKDNNFVATADGDVDTQKILYVSSNLIISAMNVANEPNDLIIWSTKDLNTQQSQPITTNQFIGKTWYMLMDNSDNSAIEPKIVGFKFNSNGSLTATEPSESNEYFEAGSWSVTNGVLTTTITDENETYTYINTIIEQSSDYMVIKETNTDNSEASYAVLFNDKARPLNILKQWETVTGKEISSDASTTTQTLTARIILGKNTKIDTVFIGANNNPDKELTDDISITNNSINYSNIQNLNGTYAAYGWNNQEAQQYPFMGYTTPVTIKNGVIQGVIDFSRSKGEMITD